MHIERNLIPYIAHSHDGIAHALQKISRNRAQTIFCVSQHGTLEGMVTDGDFRRWIVEQPSIDLDQPIALVANRTPVAARIDAAPAEIRRLFSDRVRIVPLVDARQRLVAIAREGQREVVIDGRPVAMDAPTLVIGEIGNNHNGDLGLALELVDAIADAGAHVAKFQMRDLDSLYIDDHAAARQGLDLGDEYTRDLLTRFQLRDDELFQAFDRCRERGLTPLCTPWDLVSLEKLADYGMAAYKIASADLTNHDLLRAAAATGTPLIVSTGMSEEAEIQRAVELLQNLGAPFVLLHCNSTYPAPPKDIRLRYLDRLAGLTDGPVGYSGHERGIGIAVAAVARGARVIEKHVTLDRSMEGNDHRVSLLPDELAELVAAVADVQDALGDPGPRSMTQGERLNRETLGKSLVAATAVEAGTVITDEMLSVKSPGRGLAPDRRGDLVGTVSSRPMAAGDFFFASDLDGGAARPRPYTFGRPWGLPVRYHDHDDIVERAAPDIVEFHLSYRDVERDPLAAIANEQSHGFVVHAPELFSGDHILDLASDDHEYRKRSIDELRRIIDLTLALRTRFPATRRPGIVVNVGGFSLDRPWPASARAAAYERVQDALAELAEPDVELLPQTMPPFPWHFGGQRYHNLLVEPEEITAFCRASGTRICLDVSHTALAVHHAGGSLLDAVRTLAPHVAHLHLADAGGTDGEGLQIGEGEVDFGGVAEALASVPTASFIPEIWQGHKNGGEGFWIALDRLERWFA